MMNHNKYIRQYFMPPVRSMKWAEKEYVDHAPVWCSVDLRDGNQALVVPMSLEQKVAVFPAPRKDRFQGDRGRLPGSFRYRVPVSPHSD